MIRPGPSDKREVTAGTWSIEEGTMLVIRQTSGAPLRFRIISIDAEQLVLDQL